LDHRGHGVSCKVDGGVSDLGVNHIIFVYGCGAVSWRFGGGCCNDERGWWCCPEVIFYDNGNARGRLQSLSFCVAFVEGVESFKSLGDIAL
jgi:hypothetical protein